MGKHPGQAEEKAEKIPRDETYHRRVWSQNCIKLLQVRKTTANFRGKCLQPGIQRL
jgi:hypothetical protein